MKAMLTIKKGASYALLIAMTLLSACAPPGPSALLRGKKRIEAGQYQKAVSDLEVATGILHTNADAWNYLGLAYQYSGRPDDARRSYLKALNLDRALSEARYNLGCLDLEANDLEAAKSAFTAYTIERDRRPEGFIKLGTVLSRLGDLTGAERTFQKALRLAPENPEALTGLGVVRQKRGRTVEAGDFFARALKADSQYGPALRNYAIVAQKSLRDRPLALRLYQQYLALKPPPADSGEIAPIVEQLRAELASRRAAVNREPVPVSRPASVPSQAVARSVAPRQEASPQPTSQQSSARESSRPDTSSSPANTVRLQPEAEIRVGSNVVSGPQPTSSVSQQAVAASQKPQPAKRSFLSRLFGSTPAYAYQHPAKPQAGNRAEAEGLFQQAVEARQQHRLSDAVKFYKRSTEADPSFFRAQFNLAFALAELGDLEGAAHTYEVALAIEPDSLDARYNFALLLKQMSYPADSVRELEKLVATHPEASRAHVMLGNLYSQQFKEKAKAREHYEKALEVDPGNPQAPAIRQWLADPRN